MLKKLATALTALTLALGLSAASVTSAQATDLPATPLVVLEKANCTTKANTLKIAGPEGIDTTNYRFVLYNGNTAVKQLNTAERASLFAGTLTAESIGKNLIQYPGDYALQPYYFDKGNKYKDFQTTVSLTIGSALNKAVQLGEKEKFELVDPKSLNCDKPADPTPAPADPATPGTGSGGTGNGGTGTPAAPKYQPTPATPDFNLIGGQCVAANTPQNNLLTVDPAQKKDNYRFIAQLNGQAISLKEELRNKLWADGKISAEDIAAAYPGFKMPYGETITVQPYWFDKEQVNDPASYDTKLKLSTGKSDRFIKIGEAKTVTLVDPAGLDCKAQQSTDQSGSDKSDTAVPVPQPAATTTTAQQSSGKSGNLAKTGAADSTLAIGAAAALLGLGAATFAVRRRKAS